MRDPKVMGELDLRIYWNKRLRCSREAWESFLSVVCLCFSLFILFILLFWQTCFSNFPICITENGPTQKTHWESGRTNQRVSDVRLISIAWYSNPILLQSVTTKKLCIQKMVSPIVTTWIFGQLELPGKGTLH